MSGERNIRTRSSFLDPVAVLHRPRRWVLSWRLSNTLDARSLPGATRRSPPTSAQPLILNTDEGYKFTSAGLRRCAQDHRRQDLYGRPQPLVANIFMECPLALAHARDGLPEPAGR